MGLGDTTASGSARARRIWSGRSRHLALPVGKATGSVTTKYCQALEEPGSAHVGRVCRKRGQSRKGMVGAQMARPEEPLANPLVTGRLSEAQGVIRLHGLSAVAPLKLPVVDAEHFLEQGLHGLSAVAPLKLRPAADSVQGHDQSPRPHSRGSIEARTRTPMTTCSRRRLHGLTAVAPLKRLLQRASTRGTPESPRPPRPGPIEAASRTARTRSGPPRLHDLSAVAPLKRVQDRAAPDPAVESPRPHSRGPIEA